MASPQIPSPETSLPRRATRRRPRRGVLVAIVVLVVLGGAGFFWGQCLSRIQDQALRLTRDADGKLVPLQNDKSSWSLSAQAHVGKIAASSSFTSMSSSGRSGSARFACRSIMILNRSSHPLMAVVGQRLVEHVKPWKDIETLEYYPAGLAAEPGELAPDLVVVLDLQRIEESGLAFSSMDATISIRFGSDLSASRHHYHDVSSMPPTIDLDWNGQLHYQATIKAIGSTGTKYRLAGEDIAKQIAGKLLKEFEQRCKKEGVLPKLHAKFYPAYHQAPQLPLVEGDLDLLVSWHGLMNRNETLWQWTVHRQPGEVLSDTQKRLEAAGWKVGDLSKQAYYLRATRGAEVVQIYQDVDDSLPVGQPQLVVGSAGVSGTPPRPFQVHYVKRMTREELDAAIDKTLRDGASAEVIALFEPQWNDAQRRRALELLKSQTPATVQAALTLGRLYLRCKQPEPARQALVRARVLLCTVGETGDLPQQLKSLAKELGDENLAETPLTAPLLTEAGFMEITPEAGLQTREVGLDEPVHWFGRTAQGDLKTISLCVVRSEGLDSRSPFSLAHVDSCGGCRSWGSSGMRGSSTDSPAISVGSYHTEIFFTLAGSTPAREVPAAIGSQQCHSGALVTFDVRQLAPAERFRMTVQLRRGPTPSILNAP